MVAEDRKIQYLVMREVQRLAGNDIDFRESFSSVTDNLYQFMIVNYILRNNDNIN